MPAHGPNYDELVAYAAGELPVAEAVKIEAYLATDATAAATVARFRMVAATARADDSEAPPAESVRAAKVLFRERQARLSPTWLAELKRIVARLTADTRPMTARVGVRGRSESYQLAFESDVADVDLEIDRPAGQAKLRRLRGQVSPHGDQRVDAIALTQHGTAEPIVVTEPDEHGAFSVRTAPGRFDVFVSLREAVLVLPDIEVE